MFSLFQITIHSHKQLQLPFTPKHSSILFQPHRPPIPISSRCVLCLSVCLFCPRIPISTRCVLHLSVCLFRPYLCPLRFVVYLSACFVPVFPSLSFAFCGLSVCLFCPRIPISVRCVLWSIFLLVLSSYSHLCPLRFVVYLSSCSVRASPSLAAECSVCFSVCLFSPRIPIYTRWVVLYFSIYLFCPRIPISSPYALRYMSVCLFCPCIPISASCVLSVVYLSAY